MAKSHNNVRNQDMTADISVFSVFDEMATAMLQ